MSYVVMVFFRVFGYSPEGARQHMLTLPGHWHLAYAWYLFLAGLQSLLVREIDPSCEEGG